MTWEIKVRVPAGSYRLFDLAATIGQVLGPPGTPVWDQRGVVLHELQRSRVLTATNLSDRRWRQAVSEWVSAGVAHHCAVNEVVLLTRPQPTCPRCGESLPGGSVASAETEVRVPRDGSESAADVLVSGDVNGDGKKEMQRSRGVDHVRNHGFVSESGDSFDPCSVCGFLMEAHKQIPVNAAAEIEDRVLTLAEILAEFNNPEVLAHVS